jgi:hypothetical protein
MFNSILNIWWTPVFYPSSDAPKFVKGMIAEIIVSVITFFLTGAVAWIENRDKEAQKIWISDVVEDVENHLDGDLDDRTVRRSSNSVESAGSESDSRTEILGRGSSKSPQNGRISRGSDSQERSHQ